MKRVVIIALLILLVLACNTSIENKVEGFYTIDILKYKGEIITQNLGVNTISFDSNGECILPPTRVVSIIKANREIGFWSISEKDSIIRIKAEHPIFNHEFKIAFVKDEKKKLLQFILENQDIYLKASKGLMNFEQQKGDWKISIPHYYLDYIEGLKNAKEKETNVLLIFDNWSISNRNHYDIINSEYGVKALNNNVVINLLLDDKKFSELNTKLAEKYNISETPSFVIIDYNEQIVEPAKGYMKKKDFIRYLESGFYKLEQR